MATRMKPKAYEVWHEVAEGDWVTDERATLRGAINLANNLSGVVYERFNFEDVSPSGDPRGLLWDYETRYVYP